jgi:CBS domain-containing protein
MFATIDDVLRTRSSKMIQVGQGSTVDQAAQRLRESNSQSVLVMDGGRLLGILSVQDIVERVVAERLDPVTTEVQQVMRDADGVIDRRTSVAEALTIMLESGRRHLPVVEGSELFGVVSLGDLTRLMLLGLERQVEGLSSCLGAAE